MLSESDFILRCISEFIERVKKSREKSGHPSSVVFDDVLRRIDVGIDLREYFERILALGVNVICLTEREGDV